MSTSASAAFALLFAVLAPLAGCSSSSDAPAVKPIEKVCTKTACDAKESRDSSACSRCLSACSGASYNCDSSRACALSCGGSSTTCSDSERSQCIQQSIVVHLNDEPAAELLASCNRMFDHLTSCKLEVPRKTKSICATWAKVEKAENARYYDCIANKGCEDDLTACQPEPTTFGDEVCDALNARLGSELFCGAKVREALNENGASWRDDVIAVERACLALPDKSDLLGCHSAWENAVGF